MEKISNIVSGSRRVTAADLASAPAVRPGAPSFGRPVGVSTTGVRDARTTAQKAVEEHIRMSENRKISAQTPKTVAEMTNRFFMQRTFSPPAPELLPPGLLGQPVTIESPGSSPVTEPAPRDFELVAQLESADLGGESTESAPTEYVPPGTYIDVVA